MTRKERRRIAARTRSKFIREDHERTLGFKANARVVISENFAEFLDALTRLRMEVRRGHLPDHPFCIEYVDGVMLTYQAATLELFEGQGGQLQSAHALQGRQGRRPFYRVMVTSASALTLQTEAWTKKVPEIGYHRVDFSEKVTCPRCGDMLPVGRQGTVSSRDGATEICSVCGDAEERERLVGLPMADWYIDSGVAL